MQSFLCLMMPERESLRDSSKMRVGSDTRMESRALASESDRDVKSSSPPELLGTGHPHTPTESTGNEHMMLLISS